MAREAEEKERVAKEAKKARQEQEAASPISTAAESTSHEAVDMTGMITNL